MSIDDVTQEYHKIVTVYQRDPSTNFKTLLEGQWATPELSYLSSAEWRFTEKIDGTNIRIIWDGERVRFGGKTEQAQLYAPLVEWMQRVFYAGALSRVCTGPATLYGEGYGAKIQSGGKYRQDTAVILFDVWCGGLWLARQDVVEIANALEVQAVPEVGYGSLLDAVNLARAGIVSTFGEFLAEGLVMRPSVELQDRRGNRIIAKIKTSDFTGKK